MTAPVQLAVADLDALVDLVKSAGVFETVTLDPNEIKLRPACWVKVEEIDVTSVLAEGCTTTKATLHLMVGQKPWRDAFAELLPLLDALVEVVTPDGVIRPAQFTAADKAQYPGLAVPFTFDTAPEEES